MYTVQVYIVTSVFEDSAAFQAGLRETDVILKINDMDTKSITDASLKRQFTTNPNIILKIQRKTTSSDSSASMVCIVL